MRRYVFALLSTLAFAFTAGAQPPPQFTITLTDATGPSGTAVDVTLLMDANTGAAGWSWGVCHDVAFVELDEVVQGIATATANGGDPPDFYSLIEYPSGWTLGCVVALVGGTVLAPGTDLEMNVITYDLIGPDGSLTTVDFCETLGQPPISVVVVDDANLVVVPVQISSEILIDVPIPPEQFIRGDADNDGVFNGLVDAFYILNHQFNGGPAPPCFEAGDADGDSLFNGLVDALYDLAHQFQGGPPPPAPYPLCGTDPDPAMSLGCDEPPIPCNP